MITEGKRRDTTRSFVSQDSDRMRNYSGMLGRLSLTDLRRFLNENAPGIADDDIMVNYATVVWEDDASEEELMERAARRERQRVRQEEWERATLARLTEKYGPQEAS